MEHPLRIDVLVLGDGPGPVLAAQMLATRGIRCLLADHAPADDSRPVRLTEASLATLEANGLLGAVRRCATAGSPLAISPAALGGLVMRHCVADVCVTVYDRLRPSAVAVDGDGAVVAILTDDRRSWDVQAAELLDARSWPADPEGAIAAAGEAVARLLASPSSVSSPEERPAVPAGGRAHPIGG